VGPDDNLRKTSEEYRNHHSKEDKQQTHTKTRISNWTVQLIKDGEPRITKNILQKISSNR
jgi:hypothetical protein